jgi:hypothetical protein
LSIITGCREEWIGMGQGSAAGVAGPELGVGQTPTRLRLLSAEVAGNGIISLRYVVLREDG